MIRLSGGPWSACPAPVEVGRALPAAPEHVAGAQVPGIAVAKDADRRRPVTDAAGAGDGVRRPRPLQRPRPTDGPAVPARMARARQLRPVLPFPVTLLTMRRSPRRRAGRAAEPARRPRDRHAAARTGPAGDAAGLSRARPGAEPAPVAADRRGPAVGAQRGGRGVHVRPRRDRDGRGGTRSPLPPVSALLAAPSNRGPRSEPANDPPRTCSARRRWHDAWR